MKLVTKESKEELLARVKAIEDNEAKAKDIVTQTLPKLRDPLMDCLLNLDKLDIKEDYKPEIIRLTKNHSEGIPLAVMRMVLPDADRLTEARRVLREEGYIRETKDKATVTILFEKEMASKE